MEQADRIFLRDHVLSAEIGAFQSERGLDQRLRLRGIQGKRNGRRAAATAQARAIRRLGAPLARRELLYVAGPQAKELYAKGCLQTVIVEEARAIMESRDGEPPPSDKLQALWLVVMPDWLPLTPSAHEGVYNEHPMERRRCPLNYNGSA